MTKGRDRSGTDQLIVTAIEITSKLLNSHTGKADVLKRRLDQLKDESRKNHKISKWIIMKQLMGLIKHIINQKLESL